ncbi:MAG: hypothetical protein RSA85_05450 [Cellulosilyticaceae bacterium]
MKRNKKWIMAITIMSVLSSTVMHAAPIEKIELRNPIPIFDYINQMNSSLEISQNGKATVTGYIRTMTGENVALTVRLQQYTGGKWNTLYSWSDEDLYSCLLQKERIVSQGYSYRVETTGKVYDAKGKLVESVTVHSQTEYY